MKKYPGLIAMGILNGVVPFLILTATDNDLRYLFISGVILLFVTGLISQKTELNPLSAILILITPLFLGFSVIVLSELKSLGYIMIPWILSLTAGVFWKRMRSVKAAGISGIIAIILITYLFSFIFIPMILRSVLSKELNEPAVSFDIEGLD